MSELVDHIGASYNALPYESSPFAATTPEHLQTVAHLFGLTAPDPAHARVLELGCAAGGNLIPFAARNPKATALGIDLADVHVRAGADAIEALQLSNIELRQMSITDIGPKLGTFDYILCHGVYSWVPDEVRDAILRVCNENLAADGVAIVSYNTYPGWKAKEIVRDAMMLRGGGRAAPEEKLAYARGMVDFLHEMAAPDSVLKKVLDDNIELIRDGQDYYLTHEYLELCNQPCYFREFIAAAQQHGLGYLAEGETQVMFASNYGSKAAAPLLRECNGSQEVLEQLLDFLTNRTFRQTLLVHAANRAGIRYRLDHSRIRTLNVAGTFAPQNDDKQALKRFTSLRGHTVSTDAPERIALLNALDSRFPATLSIADYLQHTHADDDVAQASVLGVVEELIITGDLNCRLQPIQIGNATDTRPLAIPGVAELAAAKAATRMPLALFNVWHEGVAHLNPVESVLLPLLDGQHDHDALATAILERAGTGDLIFRHNDQEVQDPQLLDKFAREHVAEALRRLQRAGLLAAQEPTPKSAPAPAAKQKSKPKSSPKPKSKTRSKSRDSA